MITMPFTKYYNRHTAYLSKTVDGFWSQKARIEQRIVADGVKQVVLFLPMER